MSAEIAYWRTRCNECREVYGEEWGSQDEAQAYDEEGDGLCADCAAGVLAPSDHLHQETTP